MSECVIGITAGVEKARWRSWHDLAYLSPPNYTLAVQRRRGMPLLLPPNDTTAADPDRLFDLLDGLILTGGSDLDPASYGRRAHESTSPGAPERDRFELALARAALERDLPLLGICRGMQVMNVAAGGTLVQHLPEVLGTDRHSHQPGAFSDHEVRLAPGSLAARAAGADRIAVKSHHHQGLDALGEGLVPTGWSILDEVIESVEAPDRRFALGVLWHAEEHPDDRVIGSFVAETVTIATGAAR